MSVVAGTPVIDSPSAPVYTSRPSRVTRTISARRSCSVIAVAIAPSIAAQTAGSTPDVAVRRRRGGPGRGRPVRRPFPRRATAGDHQQQTEGQRPSGASPPARSRSPSSPARSLTARAAPEQRPRSPVRAGRRCRHGSSSSDEPRSRAHPVEHSLTALGAALRGRGRPADRRPGAGHHAGLACLSGLGGGRVRAGGLGVPGRRDTTWWRRPSNRIGAVMVLGAGRGSWPTWSTRPNRAGRHRHAGRHGAAGRAPAACVPERPSVRSGGPAHRP